MNTTALTEVFIRTMSTDVRLKNMQQQNLDFQRDGNPPEKREVKMSANALLRFPKAFEKMRTTWDGESKTVETLRVGTTDILNRPTIVD